MVALILITFLASCHPSYRGENMLMMQRISQAEKPLYIDKDSFTTYNKMHVGFRVRVEYDIGDL